MTHTLPARSQIPAPYTWDVESVLPSDSEWEREMAQLAERIPYLAGFRGRLGEGPDLLVAWFDALKDTHERVGRVLVYASMRYAVDTANGAEKAKNDRAESLLGRVYGAISFAEPELLQIGLPALRAWSESDSRLRIFEHYFEALEWRRAHVRSADVEEVLGLLTDPFTAASSTHGVLVDTDLVFAPARSSKQEEIVPAQGNIDALLNDADRAVRRTAWENYADAHLAVKNAISSVLSATVKQHVLTARVRQYASSLEASLDANHIPVGVFHNLIETQRRHLPTWHRYWRLRREALGYQKLHVYDIHAPLTENPPVVPYDTAVDWIAEGMAPLGDEYVAVLRKGATSERWVDIYPSQHKASGAYSDGWQGLRPFILMSYTDDIFSMSTLAHELGHSMHSYFTWRAQPFVYADYSLFVAEVASNFNQALVRAHLLEKATDVDFKITLIEEAMSNFHRYFFIMPILARLELEMHERVERGSAFTAGDLMALTLDFFREGYGDEVEIDEDRIGITWAQFPTHLHANFYVYQYATGISAANALAEGVREGREGAVSRYLSFLKAGSSRYPLDVLSLAGVDLTSPQVVERTFGVLGDMVDMLEDLVRQRSAVPSG